MAAPMSAVATAAASGDLVGVQQLVKQGLDVNARSNDGMSPLAIASFWGYANIVKVLLEHGANISLGNKGTQWTPLHCAAFQGHGKVIMYLMDYNPDLFAKDSQGRTPIDFASAIDAVWAFFAAAGCKRTPKAELIRLDIVKKVCPDDPSIQHTDLLGLTRPGSAYIFNSDSLYDRKPTDRNQLMAASTGDVLAGMDDADLRDRRI
ncbi:ankyrin repeat-containing protein DDB_G0279043-like [Littorina saxatilis]|uniref:ankyrin repeat-containing protein DDB_G0279043-like n=1 Tax=Littorina saxatilis TaxID=31220 RepID=UPI0038B68202